MARAIEACASTTQSTQSLISGGHLSAFHRAGLPGERVYRKVTRAPMGV